MSWIGFWGIFLLLGLAGFAVLAIIVTITGFGEVMSLLRSAPRTDKSNKTRAKSSEPL